MAVQERIDNRGGSAGKALMWLRAGFVVALVLGLLRMAGTATGGAWLALHIVAGLVVLGGAVALARFFRTALLWAAVLLLVVGALWGIVLARHGGALGVVHLVLMVVAVAMAEMGAAKAKSAPR